MRRSVKGILQPFVAAAAGGVTVNATGTKTYQGSAVTSLNYTGLTVAAGTNTAIVLAITWDTAGSTPTGITAIWDSVGANQALTQIVAKDTVGVIPSTSLWGLAGEHGAVATGNKTLSLAWTGSSKLFVVAMAFDGVNQTGGTTSFPNSTGANTVTTVSVSATASDKLMASGTAGSAISGLTGTTIYVDNVSGSTVNASANHDVGNAGTIGASSTFGALVGTAIKAA